MSTTRYSFLAVIPRGLQDVVSHSLKEQARITSSSISDGDDCHCLNVAIWNDDDDVGRQAVKELAAKEREKSERRLRLQMQQQQHRKEGYSKKLETTPTSLDDWISSDFPIGSVLSKSAGQHISVGYATTGDSTISPCWSCGGPMAGCVWMQLETRSRDISRSVISKSRCLGPLLALVTVQTDNFCLSAKCYHTHSLENISAEVARHIQQRKSHFALSLKTALQAWKDNVHENWKNQLTPSQFQQLQDRIDQNRLKFRISCLRQQGLVISSGGPGQKTVGLNPRAVPGEFTYSREDFCRTIMNTCGCDLAPALYDDNRKTAGGSYWTINLVDFDVELVIVILPRTIKPITRGDEANDKVANGVLAIGISLCPYSFLKTRSFAFGVVPPDISTPYLGGKMLSGVVKLRSTTAHLMLMLADLEDFDVVLDPCAGVGTIPLETDHYYKVKSCVGLGGDLVLNNPDFTKVARALKTSNLMAAWDVAFLPLRTSSVDVIVSDLPFGQQCLSVNELNQLLPLLFSECARVLRPVKGRMVLLCGGTPKNLFGHLDRWSGDYWQRPVRRVSPVAIGGLVAWIVRVNRNENQFSYGDDNGRQRHLDRVRKLTEKRDQVRRQRKSESVDQKVAKRMRRAKR